MYTHKSFLYQRPHPPSPFHQADAAADISSNQCLLRIIPKFTIRVMNFKNIQICPVIEYAPVLIPSDKRIYHVRSQ